MNWRSIILLLVICAGALAAISTATLTSNNTAWIADMLYHDTYPTTFPNQLQPGDQGVWLDVELTNYYTMRYYDISTELITTGPFEGVVTTAELDKVDPRERGHVFYQINVRDNAKPGEYKMQHKLKYYYDDYDDDGVKTVVKVERTRTASVNVYYSERIEIKDIAVTPGNVLPGEEFQLGVTLENTGSVTVNDVDVSYIVDTDASTVNLMTIGSSTKRIASIKPGEMNTISFPLKAIETATVKGYKVNISAAYTSGTSTNSETDRIAVHVIGKPAMRLAGVQADKDMLYTGVPFSLSVQLENIGTGDAKSVKAELLDTGLDGVLTSYVGTVDVDDTGSAIFDITDSKPGRKLGTTLITYEDDYGNVLTDEIEIEYFVTQKAQDYTWVFIVLVILVVGGYLFHRYRKRKREMAMVK